MDLESWGGTSPTGRTVKGTLHWVSAAQSVPVEVRLYDRLFRVENPGTTEGVSFLDEINPNALTVSEGRAEPHVATCKPGDRVQFERVGYFCADADSKPGKTVWNRTVTLRDTWAKLEAKLDTKTPAKGANKPSKPNTLANTPSTPNAGDASAAALPTAKPKAGPSAEVLIDDFTKLDLRVGVVRSASVVEGADKLLRFEVDCGEGRVRQIFSGIRGSYPDPGVLVGKRVVVIANLKPRQMKFGLSEGMILAATTADQTHRLVAPEDGGGPGDRVS